MERGIDLDVSRIEIHGMFRRTAGLLMETLEEQRQKGRQKFTIDQHGNKTIERVVGICPRTAGELSRSLNRWGQFLGLQDTPAEVTLHTLIQLSAPSDGAAFGEKCMPPAATSASYRRCGPRSEKRSVVLIFTIGACAAASNASGIMLMRAWP